MADKYKVTFEHKIEDVSSPEYGEWKFDDITGDNKGLSYEEAVNVMNQLTNDEVSEKRGITIEPFEDDLIYHLINSFDPKDEILCEEDRVNATLTLADDGYEAIVDRTSLYEDIGIDGFNTLLYHTDYTLNVYVDFYLNGDVKATMVAESDEGFRDYNIELTQKEKEFLLDEIDRELGNENKSLNDLFVIVKSNKDISEQLKSSFDDKDWLETDNGYVDAILRPDNDTLEVLAYRTELLQTLGVSYDTLMSEENTSLSLYADFYPNGAVSATLVLESGKYGGADFIVDFEGSERNALIEGLSNHLEKQGTTLSALFDEIENTSSKSKNKEIVEK